MLQCQRVVNIIMAVTDEWSDTYVQLSGTIANTQCADYTNISMFCLLERIKSIVHYINLNPLAHPLNCLVIVININTKKQT